jgi:hypothetical protein
MQMVCKLFRAGVVSAIAGAFFCASLGTASASLIVSSTPSVDTGTGFGTVPNVLTVHANRVESGCVAWDGTATIYGSSACSVYASYGSFSGGDEVGPVPNKLFTPTVSQLGINSLADLQIVFNATEPGNSTQITLNSLTLAIFDTTGSIVYAASLASPFTLDSSLQGVGKQGFPITIAPDQIPSGFSLASDYRVGLAATLGCITQGAACSGGGPETFVVSSISQVPEPATLGLIAGALIGLGVLRKRKA